MLGRAQRQITWSPASEKERRLYGPGIFRVAPEMEFFNSIDPMRTVKFLHLIWAAMAVNFAGIHPPHVVLGSKTGALERIWAPNQTSGERV